MKISKVVLCGLGAIGSSYAAKIYELNPSIIEIAVDKKRYDKYLKSGIYVNEKKYDFKYSCVDCIYNSHLHPADLVIVSVKYNQLQEAINIIRPFVAPHTTIMSLLNGIISEEIIGQALGMEKMLYSFCVGTDMVREGAYIKYTNIGKIVFGEKNNTLVSSRVSAISELFSAAGIPHQIPEDMYKELWWKFMMNVGLNQVSAILGATYGTLAKSEYAKKLLFDASLEAVKVANLEGIDLTENDIYKYIDIVCKIDPKGKTSMLQDIENKRYTEVELFSGTVLKLAKKHGISCPVNQVLYNMIKSLEECF